jgi:hypothetical protein
MDQDARQQQTAAAASNDTAPKQKPPLFHQAVTGVTPPMMGEAPIRECWPTMLAIQPGLARLARACFRAVFPVNVLLAPLGWLALAPLFPLKFAPVICRRYTLTNRRLMIQKGWKPTPFQEVALADVENVRIIDDTYDDFYLSADIEVVAGGKVALTLPAVPEPEGFRHAIVNAIRAWAPGKLKAPFQPASAMK